MKEALAAALLVAAIVSTLCFEAFVLLAGGGSDLVPELFTFPIVALEYAVVLTLGWFVFGLGAYLVARRLGADARRAALASAIATALSAGAAMALLAIMGGCAWGCSLSIQAAAGAAVLLSTLVGATLGCFAFLAARGDLRWRRG